MQKYVFSLKPSPPSLKDTKIQTQPIVLKDKKKPVMMKFTLVAGSINSAAHCQGRAWSIRPPPAPRPRARASLAPRPPDTRLLFFWVVNFFVCAVFYDIGLHGCHSKPPLYVEVLAVKYDI